MERREVAGMVAAEDRTDFSSGLPVDPVESAHRSDLVSLSNPPLDSTAKSRNSSPAPHMMTLVRHRCIGLSAKDAFHPAVSESRL